MAKCPQCNKPLRELVKRCPTCQADLGLLVDFAKQLDSEVERAADWTRAGQLGKSVWAYLQVLDVDPDNAVARQQIGEVVAAVRHSNDSSLARKVLEAPSTAQTSAEQVQTVQRWALGVLMVAMVFAAFTLGMLVGNIASDRRHKSAPQMPAPLKSNQMGP